MFLGRAAAVRNLLPVRRQHQPGLQQHAALLARPCSRGVLPRDPLHLSPGMSLFQVSAGAAQLQTQRFSSERKPPSEEGTEKDRAADSQQQQQQQQEGESDAEGASKEAPAAEPQRRHVADWMDAMMPERNWGWDNPRTWTLILLVILLQIYLYRKDKEKYEESERERRDHHDRLMKRRNCRLTLGRIGTHCNKYREQGEHCGDLECLRALTEAIRDHETCEKLLQEWPHLGSLHNAMGSCGPTKLAEMQTMLAQEEKAAKKQK